MCVGQLFGCLLGCLAVSVCLFVPLLVRVLTSLSARSSDYLCVFPPSLGPFLPCATGLQCCFCGRLCVFVRHPLPNSLKHGSNIPAQTRPALQMNSMWVIIFDTLDQEQNYLKTVCTTFSNDSPPPPAHPFPPEAPPPPAPKPPTDRENLGTAL